MRPSRLASADKDAMTSYRPPHPAHLTAVAIGPKKGVRQPIIGGLSTPGQADPTRLTTRSREGITTIRESPSPQAQYVSRGASATAPSVLFHQSKP